MVRYISDITLLEFRKRKCRLIIRNLSFQATEQNVIDKLSSYGPIVSVELPKRIINIVSNNKNNNVDDDEKMSNKMNYNNCIDKDEDEEDDDHNYNNNNDIHDSESQIKSKSMGFGFITFLCAMDAEYVVEKCIGLKICNREVAIDFCMAKETYLKFGNNDDIDGIEKDNEKNEIENGDDNNVTIVKYVDDDDNAVDSKHKDNDEDV